MIWNVALFLYLLLIGPKLLYERIKGKKHPALLQRLGVQIPTPDRTPVFWIHAVSVGEVKAAAPLFRALKDKHPGAFFLITTTTATGQAEARRSLSGADAFSYLPLDFTWIVRKWAKRLHPTHFFLIESDIWPNLLSALQNIGCKTHLVSGKMSARTFRRLERLPRIGKHLLAPLDSISVQSDEHLHRFAPFVDKSRLAVGGNLKFDQQPTLVAASYWSNRFPTRPITIASTHAPEEELLLDALAPLDTPLLLAPRHPERLPEVAALLRRKNIPFALWTQEEYQGQPVVLVDAMGQLSACYRLSRLAIVGGSFVPSVGGHNILEPCLYHTPVFFGPHMHAQTELVRPVLAAQAGRQVTLDILREAIHSDLTSMRAAAESPLDALRGATARTLSQLKIN